AGWKALECTVGGKQIFIEKPIPLQGVYEPQGRLGNESPDAFCSIIRAKCPVTSMPCPQVAEVWPTIELLLSWLRVKARHYWLLHGHVGFGASYRGSRFAQDPRQLSQINFASYGPTLIVRPLTESIWLTLAADIAVGTEPPVSEALFCDALLSVGAGDDIKAILEMGVAAEVELSHLLGEASLLLPATQDKADYAKKGDRNNFYSKLDEWPQKLGLEAASSFSMGGLFIGWADVVKELYNLRGSVAHSGKLRPGIAARSAAEYILAGNALFAYCRDQRVKAGLSCYSYPAGQYPYHQVYVFRDGMMSYVSSPLVGTFTS
ncbi:MAG TPA: hypothetical protein VGK36_20175, partial [Candidatus Angelobacter sp.]